MIEQAPISFVSTEDKFQVRYVYMYVIQWQKNQGIQ